MELVNGYEKQFDQQTTTTQAGLPTPSSRRPKLDSLQQRYEWAAEQDLADKTVSTMADAFSTLLRSLGDNPEREGLRNTPVRAAKALCYFTKGYEDAVQGKLISDVRNYGRSTEMSDIEFEQTSVYRVHSCMYILYYSRLQASRAAVHVGHDVSLTTQTDHAAAVRLIALYICHSQFRKASLSCSDLYPIGSINA